MRPEEPEDPKNEPTSEPTSETKTEQSIEPNTEPRTGSRTATDTEPLTAYLAAEGFEAELATELAAALAAERITTHGRLFITRAAPIPAAWAQNVWFDAVRIPIESIADAARKIRAMGPYWAPYSHAFHRRATLIQERLPKVKNEPIEFLGALPERELGSWTLLDANLLLASARGSSRFANGEVTFKENRRAPPSRAYLKLWELFTVDGVRPLRGERCLDLGSSPGGWTWVLASMGAKVVSVDRAELDPAIAALPGVEFVKRSAFGLKPGEIGEVDWLFSDIICYPADLLALVQAWRESGLCRNFVCTIKFKGATDFETVRRFMEIPGSRLRHLAHNKHEITWWLVDERR